MKWLIYANSFIFKYMLIVLSLYKLNKTSNNPRIENTK